jgi:hypothetical protein
MTVIAYKDGILATDTAVFGYDLIVGYRRKICVEKDFVFAACGSVLEVAAFRRWATESFTDNLRPPKSDNFGAVVIYRDYADEKLRSSSEFSRAGRVFKVGETFILYDVTHYHMPVVDGSACEFMLGVMYCGGTARMAVELAIKHSPWAGGQAEAFDTRIWEMVP